MSVLRALFLSLSITWRYVLVLPVVVIGLGIFGLMAIFVGIGLSFLSPLLAVMVLTAFVLAASVMPVMIGARLGLLTEGVKPRNGYAGLMMISVAYGIFEGLCVWVMLAFSIAAFLFLTPMTVEGLIGLWDLGTEVAIRALFLVDELITGAVLTGAAVMVVSLRAALLVPFAGASIGADPDGRPHSPFYRMGAGFVPLFIIVVLSSGASVYLVPATFYIAEYLGVADAVMATMAQIGENPDWEDLLEFGTEGLIFAGIYVVLTLWVISLQSAGAAVIYVRLKKKTDDVTRQEYAIMTNTYKAPKQDQDLIDLVRSRMPGRRKD